jgi:MOSC domain-containing protein YiiM
VLASRRLQLLKIHAVPAGLLYGAAVYFFMNYLVLPMSAVAADKFQLGFQTAIFKEPVAGTAAIRQLNLAGDQQVDLTVHGGSEKAVYVYPVEHYEYWRRQLPEVSFSLGAFGENLTSEGLSEGTLCVGDLLRAGSAILQVTQPRMPCYKLQFRFNRDDMIKRLLVSGRSGFYLSVIDPGEVSPGSNLAILDRDPNGVTISDVVRLYLGKHAIRNYFSER